MGIGPLSRIIEHLHDVVLRENSELTDGQLLDNFVSQRDEAAIAALVRRHGPMVWAVCRRILRNRQDAEDAFQATYLILVRKAASVFPREMVANWLHGVAYQTARKARQLAEKRQTRERQVPAMPEPEVRQQEIWHDLQPVLDEELDRLPKRYRIVVLLCDLEGKTRKEAARQLRLPEGTVAGRLARARTMLARRLTQRGVTLSGGALAMLLAQQAASASVPTTVAASTIKTASLFAHGAAALAPKVAHLMKGVLTMRLLHKLKSAAIVLLLVGMLITGVGLAPHQIAQGQAGQEDLAAGIIEAGAKTEQREKPNKPTGTTVTGRVVSAPGGKEVAGVTVTLWDGWGKSRNRQARTNMAGSYSFANVEPGDYYKVWIHERKEAGTWSEAVVVRVDDRPVRADDLFVTLPQSISGMVIDVDSGKPVPGATINFSTADRNRAAVKTDSNGCYCLFATPRDVEVGCYGNDERYYPADAEQKVTLLAGKNIAGTNFKIKSAAKFAGLVVFPDGKPAKGLKVLVEIHWAPLEFDGGGAVDGAGIGTQFRFTTDDEGRFLGYMRGPLVRKDRKETIAFKAIVRLPDGTMGGVAHGKTNATENRVDPLKVVLAKSAGVKLRVVDPDGKPITNATVTASDIQAGFNTDLGGPVRHLGEARYLMTGLVPGLDYHLAVQAPGFQTRSQGKELVLRQDEIRDIGDIRLEWWGKKAIPGILKKLQSADMYDRENAARQLGQLGADAADTVPALVAILKHDPANTVRYSVAAALGKIGPAAKQAVPDLIRALQEDTGGGVQREAAIALGSVGDPSALPALRIALKSSERDVQNAAAESIERLEKAFVPPVKEKR